MDLIERQAAIGAIRDMCEECDSVYCGECRVIFPGYKDCVDVLEALPSAQPDLSDYSDKLWRAAFERGKAEGKEERKTGRWIPQDFNKSDGMKTTAVYYYPKCSVCGHTAMPTNFCPDCGSDMRGEIE